MKACILLRCRPGTYRQAAKKIRQYRDVEKVFPAIGRWDVVVKVEAESLGEVAGTVSRLRSMEEVEESDTLVEAAPEGGA